MIRLPVLPPSRSFCEREDPAVGPSGSLRCRKPPAAIRRTAQTPPGRRGRRRREESGEEGLAALSPLGLFWLAGTGFLGRPGAPGRRPACRSQGNGSPTPETREAAAAAGFPRKRQWENFQRSRASLPPAAPRSAGGALQSFRAAGDESPALDRGRRWSRAARRACREGGGGGGESKNLRRRRCLPAPIRGPSVLPALKTELNSSKINLRR